MPYRPAAHRAVHAHAHLAPAARRALIAHYRAARRSRGGSSNLGSILSLLLAGFLVLALTGGLVLGVAAVGAVTALGSDLPDVRTFERLDFAQPTVIYDRTGKIELARFQAERRRVLTFEQIPHLVLDATTAAEDRTFWTNEGFDPAAIGSAIMENVSGERARGASTITQQLVRARLLPKEYLAPDADRYVRKAKELLQAARLTEAFPGEPGKQRIITAYLNQIYYGHQAYGYAAAADVYFGVTDLRKLTVAQAALLAALPKSPSTLDPYRFAQPDAEGRLVVPADAPPVVRRDWVLEGLRSQRWTKLSAAEIERAKAEPVVLAGERPLIFRAPHFSWQVRRELERLLADGPPIESGGYTVITSLDYKAQRLAEKLIAAATILPNSSRATMEAQLKRQKLGKDAGWIRRLRGRDVHNGAMAVIDYRTGEVLAYVGSAGYYRDDLASRKFDPQYDVVGIGYRQPGSAWKPIVYAAGFEERRLSAGSLLLDITTEFGRDPRTGKSWAPHDADNLERGPVTARRALQYSLNIPAIRALHRVGSDAVAATAEALGVRFSGDATTFAHAGLAGAIGTVEVRLIDLLTAYGALGNGGLRNDPRLVLEVRGADGSVIYAAGEAKPRKALSPQSAWLVSDILKGNTDPAENVVWGNLFHIDNGPRGERRPAALKTGTTNDTRDLAAYGYIAPPADPELPAVGVAVWMGNSDHSQPRGNEVTFAIDGPARVWHAFLRDYTRKWPVTDFKRPKGLVQATIDGFSGGRPGPWTRETRREWFIAGTQPGGKDEIDPAGLLYSVACGGWRVDPLKAELGPREWDAAVADWARRARAGPGRVGRYDTATAYFWGERSWGGPIHGGPCRERRPDRDRDEERGRDRDRKKPPPGDGGDETTTEPAPSPTPPPP
ncbi:MAG TPA: transglycosylase domain-containing protein [Candidatus Limnocylindrales bacterium]|nr:transglycosylase domain-containing protein [Candidatus Limnocylindrales bacterium]